MFCIRHSKEAFPKGDVLSCSGCDMEVEEYDNQEPLPDYEDEFLHINAYLIDLYNRENNYGYDLNSVD